MLLVTGKEVQTLLEGREADVMQSVEEAYALHAQGLDSLPHASRLGFADSAADRIMAIPAYLGGRFNVAGVKWIASVPANVARGMDRAHALVILNDRRTGRPEAILEGSLISARRTAASAVLAARLLATAEPDTFGLIGCGPINFEVARFLGSVWPKASRVLCFDLDRERCDAFRRRLERLLPQARPEMGANIDAVLAASSVTSFATSAIEPHVKRLPGLRQGAVVLHVSLRDLAPEILLSAVNVADDVDHVCAGRTSAHLAEMASGGRSFLHASIGDLVLKRVELPRDERVRIFNPFGLGILDMAVAKLVLDLALASGCGRTLDDVLQPPWTER